MCGRYTLTSPSEQLAAVFEFSETRLEWTPRYNIAPTQPAPVVRAVEAGDRRLDLLRWGLIPAWADDPAVGSRLINARSETAADRPAFRAALRRRRCLVPATGFYEWQRAGKRKQPHHICMRDGRVFALGGLWERWEGPEGEQIESYTILTAEANKLVRPLHNRMPVVIAPDQYALWLDPVCQDAAKLQSLLRPCPPDEMVAYAVGTRVNSPANDDPSCIEPLEGTSLFP